MSHNASRRGAANLGTPLMIVAFLAIGGFMYWLYLQSLAEQELQLQQAAEAAAQAERDAILALTIDPERIQIDASPYLGDTIRLEGLNVASQLGTQGFWLEMPNGNPFLVSMSDAVKAEGVNVTPGQRVSTVGVVHEVSDSVLNAWSSSGGIGEGDRLAAEFATHYLEAQQVEVSGGGGAGAEGGGG